MREAERKTAYLNALAFAEQQVAALVEKHSDFFPILVRVMKGTGQSDSVSRLPTNKTNESLGCLG